MHHHALCSQRVSCMVCQTARRFKGLARRFLRSCVSGCAVARGFLVSAPPVSASWKPFPGAIIPTVQHRHRSRERWCNARRVCRRFGRSADRPGRWGYCRPDRSGTGNVGCRAWTVDYHHRGPAFDCPVGRLPVLIPPGFAHRIKGGLRRRAACACPREIMPMDPLLMFLRRCASPSRTQASRRRYSPGFWP